MYITCYLHRPKFMGIRLGLPEDKFRRRLCQGLLFFIIVVPFVILVIYLALRPHKPQFYVQDAVIHQLAVTADGTLTSQLQFSIISRNPNDRIGIYYDRISASATYMYQQITFSTPLQPFYQGHNDVGIISPVLNGTAVPLAPFVAEHLRGDQQRGIFPMNVRIGGKIRWKVGTWTSGHYHLNVNCFDIYTGFTSWSSNGGRLEGTRCDVSV